MLKLGLIEAVEVEVTRRELRAQVDEAVKEHERLDERISQLWAEREACARRLQNLYDELDDLGR